ncbi:MAG: hypothetical protein UV34_C0052G0003 [Parcubacteria group bacterium GW2011_GWB1_42_6]|nr:MAG: hypothetical protein UV34_C0052G0003 [Parcubacteria group bacterium GW2011_GWB1_42_6]
MSGQDLLNCFYVLLVLFGMVTLIFVPAWILGDYMKKRDQREREQITEERNIEIFLALFSGQKTSIYNR